MKAAYKIITILILALLTTVSAWAGSQNTNAPSNASKATLKARFSTDNKSVVVLDTNSNTNKVQQVILNFEDGSQELIGGLNVSQTGSLAGSSIYTGYVIIGVWVSDGTNNRITAKDSSGYGHYITNIDAKTKNSPYQGYQTDLGKVSSNNAKNAETKVQICHVPPGNPANMHTIWVAQSAVQAHLDNHCSKDHTGQDICDQIGDECGGGGVIPVELISFNAKKLNPMEVELTWATASEVNNDHFTIERTTDMATWTPVCRVDGNGNSTEIKNYSCTDHTAGTTGSNTLYYRPMQMDFNGAYEYFNVIKLRLESAEQPNAVNSIYPNPAIDRINIQYNASENGVVNIRLLSIEGKSVLTSTYKVTSGQQTVDINLPEDKLAKGMYLLEVESEGLIHREKIYKQ